jgi:hypothetical protein
MKGSTYVMMDFKGRPNSLHLGLIDLNVFHFIHSAITTCQKLLDASERPSPPQPWAFSGILIIFSVPQPKSPSKRVAHP